MSKLIFDSLDVSKKQTKKYVVLDKWHEKTISDSLLEKKNIDYLNAFIFSIEDESNEVDMVDDIYEKLLFELSKKLNKIHGINWSLRSWRIFIGPWVNRFVAIIYDRVKILLPLANNNEINCERQIEIGKNIALASFDMRDFTDKILKKEWNDKLMCRIIYILKKNNFSNEINLKNSLKIKFEQKIHKVYYFLNFLFFNFLKILFYPFTHKNKYIFYKPYFGSLKNTIKFILKLRDIPIKYSFSFFDNFRVRKNISFKLRSEFSVETKTKDIREKITRLLVAECMPTIYLEGFSNLKRISNNCYLPKKSKVIVTFNSWRDNIFKFWLSNQVNNGAKLIYGQHGAGYGTNLKHYAERHELKICDTYLSWGWKGNSDKIYPVGDFSSFNKKDFKYVKNKKF
jgi:putative transferase (TIGR04331 family)